MPCVRFSTLGGLVLGGLAGPVLRLFGSPGETGLKQRGLSVAIVHIEMSLAVRSALVISGARTEVTPEGSLDATLG